MIAPMPSDRANQMRLSLLRRDMIDSSHSMTEPTGQRILEYSPRTRVPLRWVYRAIGLLIALLAGVGLWQRSNLLHVWHCAIWMRTQSRCMAFSPPPEQVVYDENEPSAAQLVRNPDYVGGWVVWGSGSRSPAPAGTGSPAFFHPRCVKQFWAGLALYG